MTPCSRVENLEKIKPTIPEDCTWVVVFDKKVGDINLCVADKCIESENTGSFGNPLRNEFLDKFEEQFTENDWVYILDDDNIIHPEWYPTIISTLQTIDMNVNFINWSQKDWVSATKTPKVGNIDTACYMYKPKSFENIRYEMDYTADGMFAQTIYELSTPLTLMKELCYYNYLDPKPKQPTIEIEKIDKSNIHPTLLQFLYQMEQDNK